MKKLFAVVLTLAMMLSLAACGQQAEQQPNEPADSTATEGEYTFPKMEIMLAHSDPSSEASTYHLFALRFAEAVAEATDGNIEIVIQGDAVLGAEQDYYTSLSTGAVDMALLASNGLTGLDPEHTGFFDLPFLFESDAEANAFMESDVNMAIMDKYPDTLGFRVLAFGQGGFRNTCENVRAITKMADYKGLKIRMPSTASFTDTFSALGANPTPLAYSECFTAVSQGTIDGVLLPTGSTYSGNFYEVCDYMVQDHVFFNALALTMSELTWDSLDPQVQEMLLECAKSASELQEQQAANLELTQLKDMEENHGMTITYAEDFDTTGLAEACQKVYDDCKAAIGEESFNAQMEWLENYRK